MSFKIITLVNEIASLPTGAKACAFDQLHREYANYLNVVRSDPTHLSRVALRTLELTIAQRLKLNDAQTQNLKVPLDDFFEQVFRPSVNDMINPSNAIDVSNYQSSLELLLDTGSNPPLGLQVFLLGTWHKANISRLL